MYNIPFISVAFSLSTIVIACTDCPWKSMSVHLKKMNKRNSQSLYSKVLAVSTLPGLKGSSGSIACLTASLCWEGKLEGCWMEGGWFPFLCGPGNPLLISVHLKDWLSANGKKKKLTGEFLLCQRSPLLGDTGHQWASGSCEVKGDLWTLGCSLIQSRISDVCLGLAASPP